MDNVEHVYARLGIELETGDLMRSEIKKIGKLLLTVASVTSDYSRLEMNKSLNKLSNYLASRRVFDKKTSQEKITSDPFDFPLSDIDFI